MPKGQRERGKAGKAVTKRDRQEETAHSVINYPTQLLKGRGNEKMCFFSALKFPPCKFYINDILML